PKLRWSSAPAPRAATPASVRRRGTTTGSYGPRSGRDRRGNQRARRNLPDTWALMRSPPLVSLGPSGLPHTLGPRARSGQWHMSTRFVGGVWLVHDGSTLVSEAADASGGSRNGPGGQPAARPVAG